MIEMRPVPRKTVRAIRRRLHATTPGAVLIDESVRHVPIPGTRYDGALFVFVLGQSFRFVVELCVPGLPHIFHTFEAKTNDPRDNLENVLVSLLKLKEWIENDPAFGGYVIRLNGAGR